MVAAGWEKGKVERAIGYARQSFWPLREFTDLHDVNRQARHGWRKSPIIACAAKHLSGPSVDSRPMLCAPWELGMIEPNAIRKSYVCRN
jgi:hypothetical protein